MQETIDFARAELTRYMRRITGGSGHIRLELMPQADTASPFDDAFSIEIRKGNGVIAGCCPRSVLLGVYRFLFLLGCRFFAPGADGEVLPSLSLEACTVSYRGRPALRHRGVCIEGAVSVENVLDMVDWLPKNGFNAYYIQFREGHTFFERWYTHEGSVTQPAERYTLEDSRRHVARIEADIRKRGLIYHKIGHGWTCECLGYPSTGWHTVEDEGVPPEIRPLLAQVNGTRAFFGGIPLNTHLCYSNPEARRRFVDEVADYALNHRDISILHIWLADNYNNICECSACRARSQTDWYVMLLNEIDERLTALGLDTRLAFLIYFELLWPPVTQHLKNPDRFILMFAPITRTYTRPYYQPDEPVDREKRAPLPSYSHNQAVFPTNVKENLAFLYRWQEEFHGDSFVYDYHLMWDIDKEYGGLQLARVLYDDCTRLKDMGLNGLISCQLGRAGFPSGICQYIMGRALFDGASSSFEALTEEFVEAAYGRDAALALAYLRGLSEHFSHAYIRGEDEGMTAADYVRRFQEAGAFVRDSTPAITAAAARAQTSGHGRAWRVLAVSTAIFSHLADALAEKAAGAPPARLKELAQTLRRLVSEAETAVQPDLDGMYFNMLVAGFLEHTGEAQE